MTTLDPKAAPQSLYIGWFDRLLMSPTLVHYDILAECPEGDARVVRFLSILMCLSFCWEVILFSNAAHIMLASDGTWHFGLTAVAVLAAMIVLLADAIVFIAGSWHVHGLAEIERTHEFKLPKTRFEHAKGGVLVGGRFVMALLIANFIALTTGLLAFEKDIDRILRDRYLASNATLFSESAQREDTELQKNKAAQQELGGLILQAETEEKGLRALSLEPKVDDSELKLALQRVCQTATVLAASTPSTCIRRQKVNADTPTLSRAVAHARPATILLCFTIISSTIRALMVRTALLAKKAGAESSSINAYAKVPFSGY